MTTAVLQKPSLSIVRRIKAPPAKVFAALTDPAKIAVWFGQGTPESKSVQTDVRPGGLYHFGFIMQSGEASDVHGAYKEIVADKRLVFSWYWKSTPERQSQVTIDLAPDGEGTVLTLNHEQFYDETARDQHNVGWTYGLDALQALVEG